LLAADWTTFNNKQATGLTLLLTGGTMSGNIAMGGNKVTGLASGTATGDALQWGQIGAANGVAGLDAGGKVPVAQLPNSIMEYQDDYMEQPNNTSLAPPPGATGTILTPTVVGANVWLYYTTTNNGIASITYSTDSLDQRG
jgi:hypothetical protein